MQVKVRQLNEHVDNVIERVLRLRGIDKQDIGKFLFPDESMKPDYKLLDNIEKGIDLLHKHIEDKDKIMIVVDPDMDGYSSASIIYQYLIEDLKYPEYLIAMYLHEGKRHGLPYTSEVMKEAPKLVITPDAASSDYDKHKELKEKGVNVLVIDHHLAPKESEDAVVINNQLSSNFPWKALTGSNMAYLFCEAYSDKYNEGKSVEHYLDLSFIGQIADRADLRDLGSFYFYYKGSQSVNNELIRYIVDKDTSIEYGKKLTARDVGWKIAPFFNAIIRSGSHERQKIVVEALNGSDEMVYNTRLKDEFPIIEEALRAMTTARNRQSTKTKKAMELIEERVREMGSDEHKVILVNATDIIDDSSLTGLIASKVADLYKKPAMIMKYYPQDRTLKGSMRGFANMPIESFKDVLESTGLMNFVAGHDNAAGFELSIDNALDLTPALNELLSDVEYDNLLHEVDISYYQQPDAEEVLEIAKHEELWGEGIESPKVHVEDIIVNKSDIRFIGSKGNVWSIDLQTCQGIMFNLSEGQKLALTNHEDDLLKISIVGECSINDYRGQKRPQIIIEDFSVEGVSEKEQDVSPWAHREDTLPF